MTVQCSLKILEVVSYFAAEEVLFVKAWFKDDDRNAFCFDPLHDALD